MVSLTIILGILIGGFVIISIMLCGNVIFQSWKLHYYLKEKYPSKFDIYKSKFSLFSATKIINYLNDNDPTLKEITTIIEKRFRFFCYYFPYAYFQSDFCCK